MQNIFIAPAMQDLYSAHNPYTRGKLQVTRSEGVK